MNDEATPEAIPEATPEAIPEATPEAIPEAIPEATPESARQTVYDEVLAAVNAQHAEEVARLKEESAEKSAIIKQLLNGDEPVEAPKSKIDELIEKINKKREHAKI